MGGNQKMKIKSAMNSNHCKKKKAYNSEQCLIIHLTVILHNKIGCKI